MNELAEVANALGAQLAGVSVTLLATGLALHALKFAARARAWQNVLRVSLPERPVRFGDPAMPYLAGIGAGAVIPVRRWRGAARRAGAQTPSQPRRL
jgi:hypothetical protein